MSQDAAVAKVKQVNSVVDPQCKDRMRDCRRWAIRTEQLYVEIIQQLLVCSVWRIESIHLESAVLHAGHDRGQPLTG